MQFCSSLPSYVHVYGAMLKNMILVTTLVVCISYFMSGAFDELMQLHSVTVLE